MATMQVTDNTKEETENSQNTMPETNNSTNMSVKQHEENLSDNQKVKQGIETPTKTKTEEKQKSETKNTSNRDSVDVAPNKKLSKDGEREVVEDVKFFEEKDILEYLYQKWLLDGANWLFNKTRKGFIYFGDKLINAIQKRMLSKHHPAKDSTTSFAKDANSSWEKYTENANKKISDDEQETYARLDRFNRCEFTDEDRAKYPELCKTLESQTPKERAKTCNAFHAKAKERAAELKLIHYLASSLTRAQIVQNAMSKEKPGILNQDEFNLMCKRNKELIDKQLEQTKNKKASRSIFFYNLYNQAKKANKTVDKSLEKGRYRGNPKKSRKPKENYHLNDANKSLGIDENGQELNPNAVLGINSNTQTNTPQYISEAASVNDEMDRTLGEVNQELTFATQGITNRQEENRRRKEALEFTRNKIEQGLGTIPKELRKENGNDNPTPAFNPHYRTGQGHSM